MLKIFLCGFMGCGKSTLAKLISQKLPLKLIDIDFEIENRFNLSVSNIFFKFGEKAFRDAETHTLKTIVNIKNQRLVVATGGATLINNSNFKILDNQCKTILLDTSFDVCFNRIKNSNRPLLLLGQTKLKQLFLKRQPIYKKTADKILTEETSLTIQTKLQMALNLINNII